MAAAERSGALIRHRISLEQGELDQRRLWLRPEVSALCQSAPLDGRQLEMVRAALRRFILGGPFTIVTADCPHQEVKSLGDIRELKTKPPPFVELRFRPPPHDLRLFGRFVAKDSLVLTTHGMKSLSERTGQRRYSIPEERKRCDQAFQAIGLSLDLVPPTIQLSITNASFA